jgi:hypothetical protein
MKTKKSIDIKKLIEVFADKTGCNIQFNGCPCNTCFHSIENVDFRHIVWLILLGLRGDYEEKEILDEIKKELGL